MLKNKIPLCQKRIASIEFQGEEGMAKIEQTMTKIRTTLPETIGGMHIVCVKDYLNLTAKTSDVIKPLSEEHNEDLVIIELEEPGNCAAIRPLEIKSPKELNIFELNEWLERHPDQIQLIIEFRMATQLQLSECQDLISGIAILQSRLDAMESDLRAVIE